MGVFSVLSGLRSNPVWSGKVMNKQKGSTPVMGTEPIFLSCHTCHSELVSESINVFGLIGLRSSSIWSRYRLKTNQRGLLRKPHKIVFNYLHNRHSHESGNPVYVFLISRSDIVSTLHEKGPTVVLTVGPSFVSTPHLQGAEFIIETFY